MVFRVFFFYKVEIWADQKLQFSEFINYQMLQNPFLDTIRKDGENNIQGLVVKPYRPTGCIIESDMWTILEPVLNLTRA